MASISVQQDVQRYIPIVGDINLKSSLAYKEPLI